MSDSEFATVDDLLVMLRNLSGSGLGEYVVGCNLEYYLAKKDDIPEIDHKKRCVDYGGYTE